MLLLGGCSSSGNPFAGLREAAQETLDQRQEAMDKEAEENPFELGNIEGDAAFYFPVGHSSVPSNLTMFKLIDCLTDGTLVYAYQTLYYGENESGLNGENAEGVAPEGDYPTYKAGTSKGTVSALMTYNAETRAYKVLYVQVHILEKNTQGEGTRENSGTDIGIEFATTDKESDQLLVEKYTLPTETGGVQYAVFQSGRFRLIDGDGNVTFEKQLATIFETTISAFVDKPKEETAGKYWANELAVNGKGTLFFRMIYSEEDLAGYQEEEDIADDGDIDDAGIQEFLLSVYPVDGTSVLTMGKETIGGEIAPDSEEVEEITTYSVSFLDYQLEKLDIVSAEENILRLKQKIDNKLVYCEFIMQKDPSKTEGLPAETPAPSVSPTLTPTPSVTEEPVVIPTWEECFVILETCNYTVTSSTGTSTTNFYGKEDATRWVHFATSKDPTNPDAADFVLDLNNLSVNVKDAFLLEYGGETLAVLLMEDGIYLYPNLQTKDKTEVYPRNYYISVENQKKAEEGGATAGNESAGAYYDSRISVSYEGNGVLRLASLRHGLVRYDLQTKMTMQISSDPCFASWKLNDGTYLELGLHGDGELLNAPLSQARAYRWKLNEADAAIASLKLYLGNNRDERNLLFTSDGRVRLLQAYNIGAEAMQEVGLYLDNARKVYQIYLDSRNQLLKMGGVLLPTKEECQRVDQRLEICTDAKRVAAYLREVYAASHTMPSSGSNSEWDLVLAQASIEGWIREEQNMTKEEYDGFLDQMAKAVKDAKLLWE